MAVINDWEQERSLGLLVGPFLANNMPENPEERVRFVAATWQLVIGTMEVVTGEDMTDFKLSVAEMYENSTAFQVLSREQLTSPEMMKQLAAVFGEDEPDGY